MTVAQLIEELKKQPQEMPVYGDGPEFRFVSIETVDGEKIVFIN